MHNRFRMETLPFYPVSFPTPTPPTPANIVSGGLATRTLFDRYGDALNFRDYLAPTDGQSSDAWDRCIGAINASKYTGRPRAIYVPAGVYPLLIRTHKFPTDATIFADGGAEQTIFTRAGDYGSTFQFGDNAATTTGTDKLRAGRVNVYGLGLYHGPTQYVPGDVSLQNVATKGAHIEINGGQGGEIEENIILRMPYSVLINGGPGNLRLTRNLTIGVWDHLYPACQEGVASVQINWSSVWGNAQGIVIDRPYFQGQQSAIRSFVIRDGAGNNPVTVTARENIGFQHNLLVLSCETLSLEGGYYGCANANNITFSPLAETNATGPLTANVMMTGSVFLDSARNAEVAVAPTAEGCVYGLSMTGFHMNGEGNGMYGLEILATPGSNPSVYGLEVGNCVIRAHMGAGMVLGGARMGNVSGTISNYNCQGIGDGAGNETADPLRSAAVYVLSGSSLLNFANLRMGLGGNKLVTSRAAGNHSSQGIVNSGTSCTVQSSAIFTAPTT